MAFEPMQISDTTDEIIARFAGSKQWELPAETQVKLTIGGDTVLDKTVPTGKTATMDLSVQAELKDA